MPPTVHIYTPTNHSVFIAPANIFIGAEAGDKDGYVATVEFFENGISLGVKTNNPLAANAINPFFIYWTNVPIGAYDLTALATDNKGATTLSPTSSHHRDECASAADKLSTDRAHFEPGQ